jgi:hypothetical protein
MHRNGPFFILSPRHFDQPSLPVPFRSHNLFREGGRRAQGRGVVRVMHTHTHTTLFCGVQFVAVVYPRASSVRSTFDHDQSYFLSVGACVPVNRSILMSNRAVCIVALVCIGHALESAFWCLFSGWCIVRFRLGFRGCSICMPYRASYLAKRLACCFSTWRARSGTQRKMCFIAMIYMIQPLRVDKTANQKRANGGMWIGSCSMEIIRDYNRSLTGIDSICRWTVCVYVNGPIVFYS